MNVQYDTRKICPPERYEYFRAEVGAELVPVAVHGRVPGRLLAVQSVAEIGDFKIEAVTLAADSEIVSKRTERLIRTCDPECYRLFLKVNGKMRGEQAGNQMDFRARDIAFYDSSHPWQAEISMGPKAMRLVMLTFPRALVPIASAKVQPLIGTLIPRKMPGRDLLAEFLVEFTDTAEMTGDPDLAPTLYEYTVGLLHQRLDHPNGITPHICRQLNRARIRDIIRRHLDNPMLDPNQIAHAANISPRYLHQIFHGAELTPMQLVKKLRLEECYRHLRDPAQATRPIKDIITAHGYTRPDQFARDFKKMFGVSPTQVRKLATRSRPGGAG